MELPYAPLAPFMNERLPGMSPIETSAWLDRDEAFAPQMAYRDELIMREAAIVRVGEDCLGAQELLSLVLATLKAHDDGYEIAETRVVRPDGVEVDLDWAAPLATLARLTQEDLLILSQPEGGAEHVLIGGVLCFPSRWSLSEKFMRPLVGIHEYVPAYDEGIARRVQRLFDAITPERPLMRANWLVHPTPELHQPKSSGSHKKPHEVSGRFWLRVERQTLVRLPASRNVVFGVKTLVTPIEALTSEERLGLIEALESQTPEMRDYHGGAAHNDAAAAALRALAGAP